MNQANVTTVVPIAALLAEGARVERARIRRELLEWEGRMTINRGSEDEMIIPEYFREALDCIVPEEAEPCAGR